MGEKYDLDNKMGPIGGGGNTNLSVTRNLKWGVGSNTDLQYN